MKRRKAARNRWPKAAVPAKAGTSIDKLRLSRIARRFAPLHPGYGDPTSANASSP